MTECCNAKTMQPRSALLQSITFCKSKKTYSNNEYKDRKSLYSQLNLSSSTSNDY